MLLANLCSTGERCASLTQSVGYVFAMLPVPINLKSYRANTRTWRGKLSPQSTLEAPGMTSVPLFSGIHYEGLWISGVVWGFVLSFFLHVVRISIDIFQWLLVTIVAGLIVQFMVVLLKKRRFYNPVSNNDLIALFQAVTDDVGKGEEIQLWFRDIDRGIFLSTANPLFKAILLSESTIEDILGRADKGKIVLAKEVLMIERINSISRVAIGLLAFVLFSFFESAPFFWFPSLDVFPTAFEGPILIFLAVIALLLLVSLAPFIHSRSHVGIDDALENLYGFPPAAAKMEVFTGARVTDEALEEAKRGREVGGPRSLRVELEVSSVVAIIAFLVTFAAMYPVSSRYPFLMGLAILASGMMAFFAFVIALLVVAMLSQRMANRKRSTEWEVQVPFATDVQIFLVRFLGHDRVAVRAVKPPSDDDYGLVIATQQGNYKEKVLFSVTSTVLNDIHDPELAGPLILSEIWRKNIEKRYKQISYPFVGFATVLMFGGMWFLFSLLGFERFFVLFIPLLFAYVVLAMGTSTYLSFWKRKAEAKSDYRVARECPRFTEALQILIEKHHTLPYGITSYGTRLERIEKSLGLEHNLGEFA